MYHHVFVAGTFDGLHKGHELLLATACTEGEKVTVGITPDAFVKKHKTHPVGLFEERKAGVIKWLEQNGWIGKATIVSIIDEYQPAASDPSIDALIVTAQNRKTGEEINMRREAKGLPILTLIEVPLVSAEDGAPISTSRVASGEISPSGKLTMPEFLRPELGKPLGRLVSGPQISETILRQKGRMIVTVGDVVTKTFLAAGATPNLAVIDLRVGRQPDLSLAGLAATGQHIRSGPGFISRSAIAAIGEWAELASKGQALQGSPGVIIIDGEEDLLVLPVILAAPLDTLVYYGQPYQGVVEVEVTIEKKKEMTELLKKFLESDQ